MNKNIQKPLNIGDIISQPKDGLAANAVSHKILCVANGYIHNHPTTGVAYIDENQINWSAIREKDISRFKGSAEEQQALNARAERLLEKPYHARTYNCEHFVNEVREQIAHSPQVAQGENAALGIGLVTAVAGLCLKNKILKWIAVILGLLIAFGAKFLLDLCQSPTPNASTKFA